MMTEPARHAPMESLDRTAVPAPPYRTLLLLFVGSRVFIYIVAAGTLATMAKGDAFTAPHSILDWFIHWDAAWYLDLAQRGYYFSQVGAPTNVVFFPLLPLLVRIVSLNGLIDLRIAGYVVAASGLWIAAVWLWKLVASEWKDRSLATMAVTFLLFGPVSFFFSTVYSESWFLPLTIGSAAAARCRRWWLAGALGMLAALTRFVGIVLIVPLVWEFASAVRAHEIGSKTSGSTLVACGLPVLGFGVYGAVTWAQFGNPFLYFEAQGNWGRHFTWFWGLLASKGFSSLSVFYELWFAGAIVLAFGLVAMGGVLRMPLSFTVYAFTLGFVYVSSRTVESLPRYFSAVFPLYIAAALVIRRWPRVKYPMIATSAVLLAVSIALFVNGYWFT